MEEQLRTVIMKYQCKQLVTRDRNKGYYYSRDRLKVSGIIFLRMMHTTHEDYNLYRSTKNSYKIIKKRDLKKLTPKTCRNSLQHDSAVYTPDMEMDVEILEATEEDYLMETATIEITRKEEDNCTKLRFYVKDPIQ
jgi:hypothetical protein